MSRGFNTTLGVATTDRIVAAYTTMPSVLSIAVWANRRADGGDGFGAFAEATSERCIFGNDSGNNAFRFFRLFSGTGTAWWAPRGSLNVWHHYCATHDGTAVTNNPLMYLNGVSQTVTQTGADPTGTIVTTASEWRIGNRVVDNSKCWDGLLTGFAIWARILTQAEITALAAGLPPQAIPTSLGESVPMLGAANTGFAGTPTITGTAVQADAPSFYTQPRMAFARRRRRVA